MNWQPSIPDEALAALPVGNDEHPVHADTTGGRYEIAYGPWVQGQQMYVLTFDGTRIGRKYWHTVRKAQRAALEHMLSQGLRPVAS